MLTIILITKWNKREELFNPGMWASHGVTPGKRLDSCLYASFQPLRERLFHRKDRRLGGS